MSLAPERSRLWHPFADMAKVVGNQFIVERGEGVWIWDSDGNRYLDATASLWYANIGHGRSRMAEAITAQVVKLEAYSTFGDQANPPALRLADRLAELSPLDDARVFLTTGGGDGIETAAKLARLYWTVCGQPERTHIISRSSSFHGVLGFGTTLGGIEVNRAGFGPLVGDISQVAPMSVDALERELLRVGASGVAAFFLEPVIGAGGVVPPPPGYIQAVAELCARHDVLVICDSVIGGFGRLGDWFGIERFEIQPDLIVFAKGVTSGYLPLGGVVVAGHVAEPLWSEGTSRVFRHGTTYSGHPTCCAAALTNIDILEEEGLLTRSLELEQPLADALEDLAGHPAVAEVRAGTGLLGAVELAPELLAQSPDAAVIAALAVRRRGVIVRPLASSLAVSPPLICEPEHLDEMAAAIADGVTETADLLLSQASSVGRAALQRP